MTRTEYEKLIREWADVHHSAKLEHDYYDKEIGSALIDDQILKSASLREAQHQVFDEANSLWKKIEQALRTHWYVAGR